MNGFTLVALIVLAMGVVIAWRAGLAQGRRSARNASSESNGSRVTASELDAVRRRTAEAARSPDSQTPDAQAAQPSHAAPAPRADLAERSQLLAMAEERRRLFGDVADARAETARYRQIVVDIEHNAPPPLLDAPGAPDDLKLIVGVGPVIERMLYQMGIGTFRQIARWSERDIDEIDAKLPEFPGRIRRDGWVTQARELHLSKYGQAP